MNPDVAGARAFGDGSSIAKAAHGAAREPGCGGEPHLKKEVMP